MATAISCAHVRRLRIMRKRRSSQSMIRKSAKRFSLGTNPKHLPEEHAHWKS
jgi:hypothetical protein